MKTKIFCVECKEGVEALLVDGSVVYPYRKDLYNLPFWQCDACKNFVGCHHKTSEPTKPLGCIPNKELKVKRMQIHSILDPLWKKFGYSRGQVYSDISQFIGNTYHTADIRSVEEAENIINFLKNKYKY